MIQLPHSQNAEKFIKNKFSLLCFTQADIKTITQLGVHPNDQLVICPLECRKLSVRNKLGSSRHVLILGTVPNRLCGKLFFNLCVYFIKPSMHGVFPKLRAIQLYFSTIILYKHVTMLLMLPISTQQRK